MTAALATGVNDKPVGAAGGLRLSAPANKVGNSNGGGNLAPPPLIARPTGPSTAESLAVAVEEIQDASADDSLVPQTVRGFKKLGMKPNLLI